MTQQDDQHLRAPGDALAVVPGWEQLDSQPSGAWRVEAGSDFAGDDVAIHPYPVSSAARTAISAAVSHAGCLRDSLFLWTGPGGDHLGVIKHLRRGQRVPRADGSLRGVPKSRGPLRVRIGLRQLTACSDAITPVVVACQECQPLLIALPR